MKKARTGSEVQTITTEVAFLPPLSGLYFREISRAEGLGCDCLRGKYMRKKCLKMDEKSDFAAPLKLFLFNFRTVPF